MAAERPIAPLHHVACDYPLATPHGSSVRVLLTEDGISQVLLDWFLAPRNRQKSASWQRGYTQAFGLFYDFAKQRGHLYDGTAQQREILSDFAEALLCGTIQTDGSDPTGLYWPKVSFDVADAHVKRLTVLSDYCFENCDTAQLNPWSIADWGKRLAQFRAWDLSNRRSLLRHIGDRQAAWDRAGRVRDVAMRRRPRIDETRPPYFPPDKFADLIRRGFVVPGRHQRRATHQKFHVRDMMIAILQGAGGLRESEPFHLYLDDVREDPRSPGSALVRIHHPSEGKYRTFNPIDRKWHVISREEFLRAQGLCPRHKSGSKHLFAGWKDPLLVREKSGDFYLEVQWFPAWWGKVFWGLYRSYVSDVRPPTSSPFLFVTHEGRGAGSPYKIKQYNKKLARAVKSVGIKPVKETGGTSHGLRHHYGQVLTDADVPQAVIQKAMHHKSPESTAIYTRPDADKVNRILNHAVLRQERIELPILAGA
ncbi:gamma-mobile-trio recombinase GmtY [Methylobacterium radiotolerans]|uniref:gamma-mobile-trio recombinase GmtY n=1 Tax=Methylobacterium radiotolerans TaxID=31998 RepID=UPI001EEEA403|nr:gamma-mobile-trio recombinase GmtY [Methylobacterium radiotolerans]UIY41945.1 tyrosine-type recombinase/integrase [Methylobacterium radiotolerans]